MNPLSDTQLSPIKYPKIKKTPPQGPRDPGTPILYGASEEMSVYAWQEYEQGDIDKARHQAEQTISLWEDDAKVMQALKKKNV